LGQALREKNLEEINTCTGVKFEEQEVIVNKMMEKQIKNSLNNKNESQQNNSKSFFKALILII
jgi:hypothetical protein